MLSYGIPTDAFVFNSHLGHESFVIDISLGSAARCWTGSGFSLFSFILHTRRDLCLFSTIKPSCLHKRGTFNPDSISKRAEQEIVTKTNFHSLVRFQRQCANKAANYVHRHSPDFYLAPKLHIYKV